MIKVSVIVPVCNAGKYLAGCLGSLAGQTLKELEIIIVNDGSTDNSGEIADAFAKEYPDKAVALHRENKGPGAARNLGISKARGEYTGFADSDDRAAPDMFELLYNTAKGNDADIAICDAYMMNETEEGFEFSNFMIGGDEEAGSVADYVLRSEVAPAVWNKLFRRGLAQRIPYSENIRFAEDMATTPVLLSYSRKIAYLPQPLYYYHNRTGSLTSEGSTKRDKQIGVLEAFRRCFDEGNPVYRDEMNFAFCRSFPKYLLSFLGDTENAGKIMDFIISNRERYAENKYMRQLLAANPSHDLFGSADTDEACGNPPGPYARTLIEFMKATSPLTEQPDNLPRDMLAELHDMFSDTICRAAGNVTIPDLKYIIQIYNIFKRIRRTMNHPGL